MKNSRIDTLKERALMLAKARGFFSERSILEVDCPILSKKASVDAHIDLVRAVSCCEDAYLHSSPEYGMKRLLSEGIGDIYQLSHVFRDGEKGSKHNVEFMMAEWYRLGFSLEDMIAETMDFISLFLPGLQRNSITYRSAFKRYAGFDYVHMPFSGLLEFIRQNNIAAYEGIEKEDKDALLNLILAERVEPCLGADGLTALTHYPASQAALAKTMQSGDELVGERFEVYYKGMELANGYHELQDSQEQHKRLLEASYIRKISGKPPLPIDENFLEALKKGLPDACGVAVGFDRLMMLKAKKKYISEVIAFDFDSA